MFLCGFKNRKVESLTRDCQHFLLMYRRKGRKGAPKGVWEIMDSLKDVSPDDLFPGVAYSITEDDGDEDMPYTRPVRPRPKSGGDAADGNGAPSSPGSPACTVQGNPRGLRCTCCAALCRSDICCTASDW
jgi:hypothetical protein